MSRAGVSPAQPTFRALAAGGIRALSEGSDSGVVQGEDLGAWATGQRAGGSS